MDDFENLEDLFPRVPIRKRVPKNNFPRAPLKAVAARSAYRDIQTLEPLFDSSIVHLPRDYWSEGCLFSGFSDSGWQELSGGMFPAVVRTSHPLFVLGVSQFGESVCPTTTLAQGKSLRIPKGTKLEVTGHLTSEDAYVLHKLTFTIAPEETLDEKLLFRGVCPSEKLEEVR